MEQQANAGFAEGRGATVIFVVLLTIILAATVSLLGIAYVNQRSAELVQQNLIDVENEALTELRQMQTRTLSSREWIDEAKGTAKIPIEDAIKVVADSEAEKDGR